MNCASPVDTWLTKSHGARPCAIAFFRLPIGTRTRANRFRQSLNKNCLEYILILHSVESKRLDPQCFGLLRGQFVQRRDELRHINV